MIIVNNKSLTQIAYTLNVVLNIPLVIPHQDKSNFANREHCGSTDMSISYENVDQ